MKDDVKVSIVVPTFNREDKILKPLYSIIKQTYKNWELIIIDDGSTDNTHMAIKQVLETYPSKYIKLAQNSGPSFARNRGMEVVTGTYSAFLDSDDAWENTFLEKMVNILNRNHDISLAYCDSQIYDLERKPYYVFTFEPYNYMELINSQGRIPTGSFVFRTQCWSQIDPFREDMIRGEDFEWQLRFGELFDFKRHPEILHYYFRDRDGLIHSTCRQDLIKKSMAILTNTKVEIQKRKFGI